MTDKPIHTYILCGYDHNSPADPFPGLLHPVRGRKDVTVIYATPGVTIEQAAKRITAPANVIIAMHGNSSSTVVWHKNESIFPNQIFDNLPPKGVLSIGTTSCEGGSVQDWTFTAPAGALVYSLVGKKTSNFGRSDAFLNQTLEALTPINLILSALGNVDPVWNSAVDKKEYHTYHLQKDYLPTTLGIGGFPPTLIDFDTQVKAFHTHRIDGNALARAEKLVCDHFYPKSGWVGGLFGEDMRHREQVEKTVDAMRQGKPITDASELRVAYAIAISYLDQTGRIKHIQDKKIAKEEELERFHQHLHKDKTGHMHYIPDKETTLPAPKPENITAEERAFEEMVKTKMKGFEHLPRVINALNEIFSETPGNDKDELNKRFTSGDGAYVFKKYHVDVKKFTRD